MSNVVPFTGGQLPAYLRNRESRSGINKDVAVGASFPSLSIKGKVFTLVKDNERKLMTKPEDPDEVLQFLNVAVIRANTKARVFYDKGYVEGESDGARPACASMDSVTPLASSPKQQAPKCNVCPHAVWGTGNDGQGTACTVNTRLAIADPDKLDEPILLRVPAGSRRNFNDTVKAMDTRGVDYNQGVLKIGFDPTAPSPRLTFKPIGLLSDEAYAKIQEMYANETVLDIVGVNEPVATNAPQLAAPVAPPAVDTDELDAALAVAKAAKSSRPKGYDSPAVGETAAIVEAATKPVKAAPAKPVAVDSDMDSLLGDLDSLFEHKDD
jgi:hypothetical protein